MADLLSFSVRGVYQRVNPTDPHVPRSLTWILIACSSPARVLEAILCSLSVYLWLKNSVSP